MGSLRVIQKTLVYVIGIAPEIATEETLKRPEYFGQYGDLQKVVVNTNNVYNATRGGSILFSVPDLCESPLVRPSNIGTISDNFMPIRVWISMCCTSGC